MKEYKIEVEVDDKTFEPTGIITETNVVKVSMEFIMDAVAKHGEDKDGFIQEVQEAYTEDDSNTIINYIKQSEDVSLG